MLAVTQATIKDAFLEAVIDTGSITDAAEQVGISRQSPYDWLDAEYSRGVDKNEPEAGSFAYRLLQAKRLAGEKAAGRIHWHSNHSPGMPGVIASIAAAKRYDPLWNDKLEVRHSGTVWTAHVDLNALSDADRAQLLSLAAERATLRLAPESTPPSAADAQT